MTARDRIVLLVVSDAALKQQLVNELALRQPAAAGQPAATQPVATRSRLASGHYQVFVAGTLNDALDRLEHSEPRLLPPAAIVLDESALGAEERGAGAPLPAEGVRRLAEIAPVILVAANGRLDELNGLSGLLAEGKIELVGRTGLFLPLVLALVERHAARAPGRAEGKNGPEANFGEVLRHEMNNPLTGILGNAELLLARRDQLPPAAVERLETIAELAVRLRETVRRLSNALEAHSGTLKIELKV